eukprot:TRINITY_DN2192_c0_g1_i1.p1 TRINITY_DN2192_c0_g1~~TRINITY_DN2192_c0_g1_i1.p1  ORF type:complete len:224 (+),score=65.32 TRINITY_DN2192_c0_g1_i1:382-1053(+)
MASPTKKSDIFDRLTDSSKYTGTHKNRFDAEGKGKGKAGRVDIAEDDGYVASFREKKDKPAGEKKEKQPDIVSRLTDPKLYTGAHKSRFDPTTGKGLGVNQTIDKDVPRDLSDLTRPALHAAPRAGASPEKKVVSKPAAPKASSTSPTKAGASSSPKPKPDEAEKKVASKPKGDIFDRLTNPALYTGSHKNRFDADGKGKGIDGRVDRAVDTGYVQGAKLGSK